MNKIIQSTNAYMNDQMITLSIDDGGKFTVQRALLCGLSDYFKKALTGDFMETGEKGLKLPGCTITDVQLLLYWATHENFPNFVKDSEGQPSNTLEEAMEDVQIKLVHIWVAADVWLLPRLQNTVMRALRQVLDTNSNKSFVSFLPRTARLAWEETAKGFHMRAMMMHQFLIHTAGHKEDSTAYDDTEFDAFAAIPGFFRDYAMALPDQIALEMDPDLIVEFLVPEGTGEDC